MALIKDEVHRTCLENELRMVLVGKTGVGKSETGNTIAGEEIFHFDASAASVTTTSRQHTFVREGQYLQLIDVPGFVDTNLSEEVIKAEVVKCVALSHPGLHAILFMTEVGRFTDDDIQTIEQFCRCFGEESIEFVIIIFTKIDSLKRKKTTLDNYIREAPPKLKDFLAKTKNRYLGVNNWSEDDAEKESFFMELLSKVKSLVDANGGRYYTNEMYQQAEQKLKENIEMEMERLAEEEKEKDEEKLRQVKEEYKEELEKQNIEKEKLERQMEDREAQFKKQLDDERRARVIKQQRETIGSMAGSATGLIWGSLISFIGSEAFEYAGAAIGFALGGPAGAVVGYAIGGVVGVMATSSAMGYVGGKIGNKLAED